MDVAPRCYKCYRWDCDRSPGGVRCIFCVFNYYFISYVMTRSLGAPCAPTSSRLCFRKCLSSRIVFRIIFSDFVQNFVSGCFHTRGSVITLLLIPAHLTCTSQTLRNQPPPPRSTATWTYTSSWTCLPSVLWPCSSSFSSWSKSPRRENSS